MLIQTRWCTAGLTPYYDNIGTYRSGTVTGPRLGTGELERRRLLSACPEGVKVTHICRLSNTLNYDIQVTSYKHVCFFIKDHPNVRYNIYLRASNDHFPF